MYATAITPKLDQLFALYKVARERVAINSRKHPDLSANYAAWTYVELVLGMALVAVLACVIFQLLQGHDDYTGLVLRACGADRFLKGFGGFTAMPSLAGITENEEKGLPPSMSHSTGQKTSAVKA